MCARIQLAGGADVNLCSGPRGPIPMEWQPIEFAWEGRGVYAGDQRPICRSSRRAARKSPRCWMFGASAASWTTDDTPARPCAASAWSARAAAPAPCGARQSRARGNNRRRPTWLDALRLVAAVERVTGAGSGGSLRDPRVLSPRHPSRLSLRYIRIANLAPPATTALPLRGDDGISSSVARRTQ